MKFLEKLKLRKNRNPELLQAERALQDAYSKIDLLQGQIDGMKREYVELRENTQQKSDEAHNDAELAVYRAVAPLLIAYPKACAAVEARPETRASDVIGMLRPVEKLIELLDLEQIGVPGERTVFDPAIHVSESAKDGDDVVVRSVGFIRKGAVLDRAVVRGESL